MWQTASKSKVSVYSWQKDKSSDRPLHIRQDYQWTSCITFVTNTSYSLKFAFILEILIEILIKIHQTVAGVFYFLALEQCPYSFPYRTREHNRISTVYLKLVQFGANCTLYVNDEVVLLMVVMRWCVVCEYNVQQVWLWHVDTTQFSILFWSSTDAHVLSRRLVDDVTVRDVTSLSVLPITIWRQRKTTYVILFLFLLWTGCTIF